MIAAIEIDGREIGRWMIGATLALAAHAGLAVALVHWKDEAEAPEPLAAIVLELAPVPVAPSDAEEDVPLEPEQVQEIPPEKPEEKVEEKVEDKIEPEPQTEVAVTVPPPRVEEQPKPEQPPAPAPSAPRAIPKQQSSKIAAAPVQGQPSSNNSSAVQSWKSQVVSMLERNKRYPADARLHRQQGVAQLAFTLDRQGQVATAEIVRSTGSSSLDNETLALVRRAAPFPPPPPELPGAQVSLMVPIRFNFR